VPWLLSLSREPSGIYQNSFSQQREHPMTTSPALLPTVAASLSGELKPSPVCEAATVGRRAGSLSSDVLSAWEKLFDKFQTARATAKAAKATHKPDGGRWRLG